MRTEELAAPTHEFYAIGGIYISPTKGVPMTEKERVHVEKNQGISGDRYEALWVGSQEDKDIHRSNGYYSGKRILDTERAVTFFSLEALNDANDELIVEGFAPLKPGETRRNFGIEGVTAEGLNVLVGHKFELGGIPFLGTELCTPCKRPTQLRRTGNPLVDEEQTEEDRAFIRIFKRRGGIRAIPLATDVIFNTDRLAIPMDLVIPKA